MQYKDLVFYSCNFKKILFLLFDDESSCSSHYILLHMMCQVFKEKVVTLVLHRSVLNTKYSNGYTYKLNKL